MRLTVLCSGHGKTQNNRLGFGEASPIIGRSNGRHSGIAHGASCSVARPGTNDLESGRQGDRRWAGDGGSPPDPVSPPQGKGSTDTPTVGRTAASIDALGRRAGPFGCLETQGRARSIGGGDAAAGGAGRKTRAAGKALSGVSPIGSPPLAKSCPRYPASQGSAHRPRRVEKKRCPKSWRPC